jgi:hypothetical protein
MSSKHGGPVRVTKDRISLNPDRDRKDSEYCEQLLANDSLRNTLECTWYCLLSCGEPLRTERCKFAQYRRAFSPPLCDFGTTERHVSMLYRAFDTQHSGEEIIDFIGYVKSLFHLGMERFGTTEYDAAFNSMLKQFLEPFLARFRATHDLHPSTPDGRLLEDPDMDNILYVYDGVFERLFNRYRAADDHENRDLTLEQSVLLDQYVELPELREMVKDYGFFPRHLSWVEISTAAQFSCFGCIVRDPGHQTAAFQSNIESVNPNAIKELRADAASKPIQDEEVSQLIPDFNVTVKNPLYVDVLPTEYLRDEPLLDRPRFMTALLRVGQALYNRSDFVKRLPTGASRVEEMLAHMAPTYERAFGRTMDSDCDFTERGVPVLLSSSSVASLQPSRVPMSGNVDVTIAGNNFGEKRGVFVRFGPRGQGTLVRCVEVSKRRVVVRAPAAEPQAVAVDLVFTRGQYLINVARTAQLQVECSNNRVDFSATDPPQLLSYVEPLPGFALSEDLTTRLLRSFAVLCAVGQPYNSKFLTQGNWHRTKKLFAIHEGDHDVTTDRADLFEAETPRQDANTHNAAHGTEGQDMFFLLHSQLHEGAPGLSVDFKGYLATLTRCFFAAYGPDEWHEHFERIADVEVRHTKNAAPRMSLATVVGGAVDESKALTDAIEAIERRTTRELDVYLGPVLCGFMSERPGDLASNVSGARQVQLKGHNGLSYVHYDDVNSEKIVLAHLTAARTFSGAVDRLLQNGFDVGCHDPDRRTRKPVGRCWAVLDKGTPVGALWDYPGHLTCLEWQPAPQQLQHTSATLTVYLPHTTDAFRRCFQIFTKSGVKGAGAIRDALVARGFTVSTKLYRVP